MRAIDRKLLRDLWQMKGQAVAICLVIMSGVALFVAQIATLERLRITQQEYYNEYRFADVFASCKRAPESVARQILAIEGVESVQTRILVDATLDIEGLDQPAIGRLVSLPDTGRPELNDVHLRSGRWPTADNEVLANESFAMARGYRKGSTLGALLNGRKRTLVITGVGLSPSSFTASRAGLRRFPTTSTSAYCGSRARA